ncbi:alpha/beta hydrolase [Chloroflexus sp.]|uniref:alpha/beta hydrolase n=1 Tax=Chloroflexus sp. TaxID=1904827 RepID=UPI00298EF125|nr:alpha/beta hydrolase [Chloroflexus sp.]MCS6886670.1 alpha/beta hydrolase [Chloroflexus sp.]MDW8405646.1 alpha/beta hydrolase [Chloroflexus sp.]
MSTRHLVDPELLPLLEVFPPIVLDREQLPQIRAGMEQMRAQLAAAVPEFPNVTVTEYRVPGPPDAPDVRVLVYRPSEAVPSLPALLWIHGGGYVLGSAEQDDAQLKTFVSELNCLVASVDYRLAPETPHPGPVEDCYAALKWLHANAETLGVDRQRIAIGGASAGGGLAAGLALLARDRGEVPVSFQLLIYPMLDDRTAVLADPHPFTGEFIWNHAANHFGWSALLGQPPGSPDVSPYAAAARAENLAGLPATFINTGALDLFLEEDIEYARRLTRAGVPTELHVYPGAYHGFNLVPTARVSQAFQRDILNALRRAFYG